MLETTVLVLDPAGISRVGMQLLLAGELGVRVRCAGNASDLQSIFAADRAESLPRICIVNIGAPWGAGLELLKTLKTCVLALPDESTEKLRILALGNCAQAGFDDLARQAGADIIFNRRAGTRRLTDLVRRLLSGEYTSASLLADHSPSVAPVQGSPRAMLSRREHEVFALMAAGAATRDIAARLKISIKTVASHRARIMEKIHLRDHADLIRYALRTGVIESN